MTIQQFHTAFQMGLDKIDSLNYPNILPEEIDFILNQAQDRFIKQRYGKTNPKHDGFEETQKRAEDLKVLVQPITLPPNPFSNFNINPNARFYTLAPDHRYIIQENCDITYLDCHGNSTTKTVLVRPIQHSDYDKIQNDPFNRPSDVKVLRLMAQGQVEIIAGAGYTLGNYYLRYLRSPVQMSIATGVTCELSLDTHQEIVSIGVDIALESIESKRGGTFNKIVNQNE